MKDINSNKKPISELLLPYAQASIFGIFQSISQIAATQPLNNAKIHQQTIKYPTNLLNVLRELGLIKLYQGSTISLTKMGAQNMIINPVILFADRSVTKEFCEENPLIATFIKSFVNTVGKISLNPLDVALVNKFVKNISVKETFNNISSKNGIVPKIKAGYVGAVPEALSQLIGSSCFFFIKDQIHYAEKMLLGIENENKKLSPAETVFAGSLVSVLKTTITHPLNTVATVMRSLESEKNTIGDALNHLKNVANSTESSLTKVLYRGMLPRALNTCVGSILTIAMLNMLEEEKKGIPDSSPKNNHDFSKLKETSSKEIGGKQ